jgi:hypothetical protein
MREPSLSVEMETSISPNFGPKLGQQIFGLPQQVGAPSDGGTFRVLITLTTWIYSPLTRFQAVCIKVVAEKKRQKVRKKIRIPFRFILHSCQIQMV